MKGVHLGTPSSMLHQGAWWSISALAAIDTPLYPPRILNSLMNRTFNWVFVPVYLFLLTSAKYWAGQVTKYVPEPYLVCDSILRIVL